MLSEEECPVLVSATGHRHISWVLWEAETNSQSAGDSLGGHTLDDEVAGAGSCRESLQMAKLA